MLVEVSLYREPLGIVEWDTEKGRSLFQYHEKAYSHLREPSPFLMPKEGRVYATNRDHRNFHNLPYLLSDSMLDDFGNIDEGMVATK